MIILTDIVIVIQFMISGSDVLWITIFIFTEKLFLNHGGVTFVGLYLTHMLSYMCRAGFADQGISAAQCCLSHSLSLSKLNAKLCDLDIVLCHITISQI